MNETKLINVVIEKVGDYINISADGEDILQGKCKMFTQERAGDVDVIKINVTPVVNKDE
jgi:hypothetical protein